MIRLLIKVITLAVTQGVTGTNSSSSACPQCQLCLKISHTTKTCWYRYEEDSSFEQRNTALAASSGIDNNCYTNSRAMDHITGDLDKLTMHHIYLGNDQIHAANGSGMDISRIGNSIIPPPPLVISCLTMRCMSHPHTRALFPFIVLPLIMALLLNFFLISS
jgi:hypothetical protein